MTIAICNC